MRASLGLCAGTARRCGAGTLARGWRPPCNPPPMPDPTTTKSVSWLLSAPLGPPPGLAGSAEGLSTAMVLHTDSCPPALLRAGGGRVNAPALLGRASSLGRGATREQAWPCGRSCRRMALWDHTNRDAEDGRYRPGTSSLNVGLEWFRGGRWPRNRSLWPGRRCCGHTAAFLTSEARTLLLKLLISTYRTAHDFTFGRYPHTQTLFTCQCCSQLQWAAHKSERAGTPVRSRATIYRHLWRSKACVLNTPSTLSRASGPGRRGRLTCRLPGAAAPSRPRGAPRPRRGTGAACAPLARDRVSIVVFLAQASGGCSACRQPARAQPTRVQRKAFHAEQLTGYGVHGPALVAPALLAGRRRDRHLAAQRRIAQSRAGRFWPKRAQSLRLR